MILLVKLITMQKAIREIKMAQTLKIKKHKSQLNTGPIKTIEQLHKEILEANELDAKNITIVREMAEQFWLFFDPPSQQIKFRKEMLAWIQSMNDALISYWGEDSKVIIDNCHKMFQCVGPDGREVWV